MAKNRNFLDRMLDSFQETRQENLKGLISKINQSNPDKYFDLAVTFTEESEKLEDELMEELSLMKEALRNLVKEKGILLDKANDLDEKYQDIRKRHDMKTDMVGKLTVKNLIFFTEIQRLTKLRV